MDAKIFVCVCVRFTVNITLGHVTLELIFIAFGNYKYALCVCVALTFQLTCHKAVVGSQSVCLRVCDSVHVRLPDCLIIDML